LESTTRAKWHDFRKQAQKGAKDSGKRWWWLIFKQDRKHTLVFMPMKLERMLKLKIARFRIWLFDGTQPISVMRWNDLLKVLNPKLLVKKLSKSV